METDQKLFESGTLHVGNGCLSNRKISHCQNQKIFCQSPQLPVDETMALAAVLELCAQFLSQLSQYWVFSHQNCIARRPLTSSTRPRSRNRRIWKSCSTRVLPVKGPFPRSCHLRGSSQAGMCGFHNTGLWKLTKSYLNLAHFMWATDA